MPAKKSGGGQWGITWQEVAESIDEYEEHFGCTIEHNVQRGLIFAKATQKVWIVYCRAVSGRDGAYRQEGYAKCTVGGTKGAASFPGAFLRSLIDACADLQLRRGDKRYDRDTPVPPRT
jgi:hypothetical protein